MAQRLLRPYDPEHPVAGPADLRIYLPADQLVYLRSDLVDERDLSSITAVSDQGDGGGKPPSHPLLLTTLRFYADCQGVGSSRQSAAKTSADVAFRVLTTDQHPHFRTISALRERHLRALTALFQPVVRLALRLGRATRTHVAQDGTKVRANAAKHRAMSYGRMAPAQDRLNREMAARRAAAGAADAAADPASGRDPRGDELPANLTGAMARRQRRRATIRAATAAVEAEAAADAAAVIAADTAPRPRRGAARRGGGTEATGQAADPSGDTGLEGAAHRHRSRGAPKRSTPIRRLCQPTTGRRRWMAAGIRSSAAAC